MDPWRRWETQAIRESRRRPSVSKHQPRPSSEVPGPASAREPESPDAGLDGRDPGTMLVPIDAWNRVLEQLGNLHEAGQQLAEARERAARAETESRFLRERLAELRAASPRSPRRASDAPAAAAPPRTGRLEIIRSAYRDLRRVRR